MKIGGKRYHLEDVSNFQIVTAKKGKRSADRHQLIFNYGRKAKRLAPINDYKTTLRIAEALNEMKQIKLASAEGNNGQEGTSIEPSPEQARAAAF